MTTDPVPPPWERAVLEKVALKALDEQRRTRQWNTLFRILWFAFAFLIFAAVMGWFGRPDKEADSSGAPGIGKHTAVVSLEGIIGIESKSSSEKIVKGLNRAFKDANTAGVILKINSPGGSPVQAGIINDEIRRLRAKYPGIPLYAVVQDLCASGGYYVAVAADKIFVDKASLVGSIGVIINGFGFTGSMEKLGVERRAYTAGENKDFLDPFAPENPAHKEHAKKMLTEIHQQFIDVVRKGRGARLKENPDIFSGLIWTGQRSIELGLADALGSTESVARDVIKAEKLVDFTPEENVFERFSKRFGASFGSALGRAAVEALEHPSEVR
jgi:protease-4